MLIHLPGSQDHPILAPLKRAEVNRLRSTPGAIELPVVSEARAEIYFQIQAATGLDDDAPELATLMDLIDCYAQVVRSQ